MTRVGVFNLSTHTLLPILHLWSLYAGVVNCELSSFAGG